VGAAGYAGEEAGGNGSVREDELSLRSAAIATLYPRHARIHRIVFGRGLDLHQSAHALGLSVPQARRRIARVREEYREGLAALILAAGSGRRCGVLAEIVSDLGGEPSPELREAVVAHARSCGTCQARVHPALARSCGL